MFNQMDLKGHIISVPPWSVRNDFKVQRSSTWGAEMKKNTINTNQYLEVFPDQFQVTLVTSAVFRQKHFNFSLVPGRHWTTAAWFLAGVFQVLQIQTDFIVCTCGSCGYAVFTHHGVYFLCTMSRTSRRVGVSCTAARGRVHSSCCALTAASCLIGCMPVTEYVWETCCVCPDSFHSPVVIAICTVASKCSVQLWIIWQRLMSGNFEAVVRRRQSETRKCVRVCVCKQCCLHTQ